MKILHPETANVLCLLPEVIIKAKVKVSIIFHLFSSKKGFLLPPCGQEHGFQPLFS